MPINKISDMKITTDEIVRRADEILRKARALSATLTAAKGAPTPAPATTPTRTDAKRVLSITELKDRADAAEQIYWQQSRGDKPGST
jgi:hypothetical protein